MWNLTSDFPMYLTCEVPIEQLTLDKDVVYQIGIRKGIRDGSIRSPEDITLDMCLNQGTVASLLPIQPENINEIVILGNEEFRNDLLDGQYGQDAHGWFQEFGLGHLDTMDIMILESLQYRSGIGIIEMQYPPENTPFIQKIWLEDNQLHIKFQERD